ncbi:hemagglutination domain protein [Campylobacter lari]|uniref:two-partner secretion domain-containing protein n=1 Tax=Campylobacter lari TaxID=201 RepID=UPI000DF0EB7E|nr:filamentous hemagglutinin N-terminal domain-containing protein [Campylobacter lari]STA74914.1 hemagglutination domain protein [Campylobacter lari]
MKKLANHIILSGVTVSMLFSPLMAIDPNKLPSGGKFTHGTSGTININGNNMDIMGNGKNSVIQWGGGFSIGDKAQVNFGKGQSGQNYLNIAHGTDKSTIEGVLNAGGNNVFLINPNGVIITKTGTINANRFVASTSSMSDGDMWKFANMKNFNDGLSFSPIFKPHKAGNVINMGNINANNVLLIGNKVSIDGGHINGKHNEGVSDEALKNPSGNTAGKVHLVGNEVNILVDGIKSDSIIASAYIKGSLQQSTTSYYNYGNNIGKLNFITQEYDNIDKTNLGNKKLVTKDKFEKHATIGSDIDWWHFAKGWNENKNNMRGFFDTYKLVDDIDFGASEGKNYANYCIEGLGCTNMIVGTTSAFTKTFDGQGYTLSNINIDTTVGEIKDKPLYVGIFGLANGASFSNINIDYMNGGIRHKVDETDKGEGIYAGGFIGSASSSKFYNMSLKSISNIYVEGSRNYVFAGGFAGEIKNGDFDRILIQDIGDIFGNLNSIGSAYAGGFAGSVYGGIYKNISMQNVKSIKVKSSDDTYAGGFAGSVYGTFSYIYLDKLGAISASSEVSEWGSTNIGGFFGSVVSGTSVDNIYIYFDEGVEFTSQGAKENNIGKFVGSGSGIFSNIHIYHHKNDLNNATADKSYWGNTDDKIQIHTYNDNNQESTYKDFLSKANTIEKPNHSDVSLEEDDLNKEVITQIIEDITQKGYVVDIAMLEKLLEDYNKFNENTTEGEKISFIQTYFNIKDENEARGILQSLDFLTYYTNNKTFDKNRISNEAKSLFDFLQAQSKITLDNNKALFSYLNNNKNKLIAEYNKYKKLEQIFKDKEQDYFKAEAEFNRLLDLVNKGKVSYNDPKFTQAFDNWLNAYNSYSNTYVDAKNINDNIKSTYTKHINETLGYDNFNFNPFLLSLNPDIKEPEISNIDNSQGGDLPDFEQTTSLNLIGDNALNEEEETEEVEEASLNQKNKACIVSDNFKTMNPCIVGGL